MANQRSTIQRSMATEDTFHAAYTERRAGPVADREVLTFRIADEIYALDIKWMREIVRMRPLTEVPRVPAFLPGIVTVRGIVIPIIDLRMRLAMACAPYSRHTRILIVEHEEEWFGLIIDCVLKVERLFNRAIENAPLPGGIESDFIDAIARVGGDLVVLLQLPAVVRFSLEVKR